MKRVLQVCVGSEGRLVGTLHYENEGRREHAMFVYDEQWLTQADGFALEPNLRLVRGPQFHRRSADGSVFQGVIADTEPDGWARRVILRDHAKRRQTAKRTKAVVAAAALDAVDFLLAVDDGNRVGALRFRDEAGVFQRELEAGRRTAPPLLELKHLVSASQAFENETETAADLAYLRGRGTSLGGLRPKCSVVDDDGMLAIGKFPSIQDERAITKGEVLAMTLAKAAGLNVAEARLVESDGVPVALIRRFDRTLEGKRLMYVSAATMLGAESTEAHEHSYLEIVDALRLNGAAAQVDIEELWRRIVFSILITNVDDHLRNHGFLHAGRGLWRLSPAFDLNPFPDRVRELKTWISPDSGPEAKIEAVMSVTPYFRLPLKRAKRIMHEVEKAVSKWRLFGRTLGMSERDLEFFAEAFEHPERAAARRVFR